MDRKAEFLKIWTERVRTPSWRGWSGKRTFSRPPPPPGTTERTLAACWNIP